MITYIPVGTSCEHVFNYFLPTINSDESFRATDKITFHSVTRTKNMDIELNDNSCSNNVDLCWVEPNSVLLKEYGYFPNFVGVSHNCPNDPDNKT